MLDFTSGADGGGRTHTSLRIPDFESSASANSATSAAKPTARKIPGSGGGCKSGQGVEDRGTLNIEQGNIERRTAPRTRTTTQSGKSWKAQMMNTVGRIIRSLQLCLISCAGLAAARQTGNRIPNYNSNPISNPTNPKQGRCHLHFPLFSGDLGKIGPWEARETHALCVKFTPEPPICDDARRASLPAGPIASVGCARIQDK